MKKLLIESYTLFFTGRLFLNPVAVAAHFMLVGADGGKGIVKKIDTGAGCRIKIVQYFVDL